MPGQLPSSSNVLISRFVQMVHFSLMFCLQQSNLCICLLHETSALTSRQCWGQGHQAMAKARDNAGPNNSLSELKQLCHAYVIAITIQLPQLALPDWCHSKNSCPGLLAPVLVNSQDSKAMQVLTLMSSRRMWSQSDNMSYSALLSGRTVGDSHVWNFEHGRWCDKFCWTEWHFVV